MSAPSPPRATAPKPAASRASIASSLRLLGRGIGALIDLVLPPRCVGCDALLDPPDGSDVPPAFCDGCAPSLIAAENPCACCAMPERGPLCPACARHRPPCSRVRAALLYGGQLAVALQRFKYGRRTQLAPPLARLLAERAVASGGLDRVEMVVPVPLHRRRLAVRGFNQAALLGRELARRLRRPLRCGVLQRIRDTPPQAGLSRDRRRRNVAGAFEARPDKVAGRRVLLLDDVMTTGATAFSCARALRRAGAADVQALTLARAMP